jgi:hypothetical protein
VLMFVSTNMLAAKLHQVPRCMSPRFKSPQ